ncbi:MAG: hypothetical protein ACRCSY_06070 [Cetobacterium sp.]
MRFIQLESRTIQFEGSTININIRIEIGDNRGFISASADRFEDDLYIVNIASYQDNSNNNNEENINIIFDKVLSRLNDKGEWMFNDRNVGRAGFCRLLPIRMEIINILELTKFLILEGLS